MLNKKRGLTIAVLLLLSGLIADAVEAAGRAAELTQEVYHLYKQNRFLDAGDKFLSAIRADEYYAPAHYNLARVISMQLDINPCDMVDDEDISRELAFKHLNRAIELEPERRLRALDDKDLYYLRRMVRYYLEIERHSLYNRRHVKRILKAVTWYGDMGKASARILLKFGRRSRFSIEDEARGRLWRGVWSVDGNESISLRFNTPFRNKTAVKAVLTKGGELKLEGIEDIFTDEDYRENCLP